MKNNSEDRRVNNVETKKVKPGHLMAFVYYAKVKRVNGDVLVVTNVEDGMEFEVRGSDLVERSFSADQFSETIKVTKTRAAEILVSSYNRPFTVCFDKQDGEGRVLRGRLVTPEPLLGRSKCEDLDIEGENRMRLVDHRTIKWLVVDGVKYYVSSK